MRMLHVGIGASGEGNADLFFQELLGLEKAAPIPLAAGMAERIFAVGRDMAIVNYTAAGIRFEVFIDPLYSAPERSVLHACFEVDDLEALVVRCAALGLEVNRVPKGDRVVTFIRDRDGNLYEVKEGS